MTGAVRAELDELNLWGGNVHLDAVHRRRRRSVPQVEREEMLVAKRLPVQIDDTALIHKRELVTQTLKRMPSSREIRGFGPAHHTSFDASARGRPTRTNRGNDLAIRSAFRAFARRVQHKVMAHADEHLDHRIDRFGSNEQVNIPSPAKPKVPIRGERERGSLQNERRDTFIDKHPAEIEEICRLLQRATAVQQGLLFEDLDNPRRHDELGAQECVPDQGKDAVTTRELDEDLPIDVALVHAAKTFYFCRLSDRAPEKLQQEMERSVGLRIVHVLPIQSILISQQVE